MSEVKVNKISPRSGTDVQLGDSGDTITVPSGATLDTSNSTVTLPDDSVTTAKINNEAVTPAKLGYNYNQFRNIIINGDMSIAQRGTSTSGVTTADGYYACDRFYTRTDTGTWTISQSTDVPSGQGFTNSFKLDCTSAGTSNGDEVLIRHNIEGQNVQYLKYGTSNAESLTLSFWVKSNKTGTYSVNIFNFNDTQGRIFSFDYTINSANTWEKKTKTLTGDTSYTPRNTNTTGFQVQFIFSADLSIYGSGPSNAWENYANNLWASPNLAGLGGSADDEVYLTGVQLEAGTTASDFEFLPYDVNYSRCNRYYQDYTENNTVIRGYGYSLGSGMETPFTFKTPMRASPTMTEVSGGDGGSNTQLTGFGNIKTYGCDFDIDPTTSNQNNYYAFKFTADAEL